MAGNTHQGSLILDIHATYELAPHMVVFSHGFGVERTSHGLFTDITDDLPEGYGYVLFDYYDIAEDGSINIPSLADQQRSLRSIVTWLSEQSAVQDISLVAHSMGCIIAATAQPPELNKVVMMAPPLSLGSTVRETFTKRADAHQEGGVWRILRHNGSTTFIATELFDEIESTNPEEALLDYASIQPFALLIAGEDELLPTDTDYNKLALDPNVAASTIDNASHNFTGSAREDAKTAIYDWLIS